MKQTQKRALDPIELKRWIEKKLDQIWKLDRAINEAEAEGEMDLEGVARPFLQVRSALRYAPCEPDLQKRKHDARYNNKEPKAEEATKPTKAA